MLAHMKQMSELILPQCYCLNGVTDPIINIASHGFSDASKIGCAYLKSVMQSEVSLVTAKSCIVPNSKTKKPVTWKFTFKQIDH